MLPPIRRAKRNADNLFKDRATSSSIPLWQNLNGVSKSQAERKTDRRTLTAARREVELLELLEKYPNQQTKFYAEKMGRDVEWVRVVLQKYADDDLVIRESEQSTALRFYWRLA